MVADTGAPEVEITDRDTISLTFSGPKPLIRSIETLLDAGRAQVLRVEGDVEYRALVDLGGTDRIVTGGFIVLPPVVNVQTGNLYNRFNLEQINTKFLYLALQLL
jgi:hypothetical protein